MVDNHIFIANWDYGDTECSEDNYTFICSQSTTGASGDVTNLCTENNTNTGEFDSSNGQFTIG